MKRYILIILMFLNFSALLPEIIPQNQLLSVLNKRETRLDYILYEEWNNSWNNNLKFVYHYNAEGLVEEYVIYYYENFLWKKSQRQLLSYDAAANLSNIIIQLWANGSWLNQNEFIYEYTENHQILSLLIKSWEETANAWTNQSLESSYYNGTLLDYKLTENWNGEDWDPQIQEEYFYDENDNLLEILKLAWVVNEWQSESRIYYEYEEISEPIRMVAQYYYLEDWENSSQEEYQYNTNLQLTESTNYFWSGDWINNLRREYSYNELGETAEIIQYSWQDGWQNNLRITYNYLEVTAEDLQIANNNLIYPNYFINPSQLSFSLRDFPTGWVDIYNLRGQKIKTLSINNFRVNWDLDKIPNRKLGSSIYFVVIRNKDEIFQVEKITLIK